MPVLNRPPAFEDAGAARARRAALRQVLQHLPRHRRPQLQYVHRTQLALAPLKRLRNLLSSLSHARAKTRAPSSIRSMNGNRHSTDAFEFSLNDVSRHNRAHALRRASEQEVSGLECIE